MQKLTRMPGVFRDRKLEMSTPLVTLKLWRLV